MTLAQQFVGVAARLLPLLEDEEVTDILINGTTSLFVERRGVLEPRPVLFTSGEELFQLVERLLVPIGKRVDAAHPYLDGRLLNGNRFHILLSPIAITGPVISIRKARSLGQLKLQDFGPPEVINWLCEAIRQRRNILITGGTGSGKTTLLGLLLETVPPNERILVAEEVQEIRARHPHLISLEARPPSPEGKGEVTLRTLVRQALRMRPDRIVIGECRGGEAYDMLHAMNTGHGGSLGTLHANSAIDGLRRFESLALLAGGELPLRVIREWIGANVQVVVHLDRAEGIRSISEGLTLNGLEEENYRILPLYRRNGRNRIAAVPA